MGRKATVTRRPNYGDAVLWLAANDETLEHDRENIAGLTTLERCPQITDRRAFRTSRPPWKSRRRCGRWRRGWL